MNFPFRWTKPPRPRGRVRDHEYPHPRHLREFFRLPESGGRHAGVPAVRRHPRLHADVAAGRAHHAVPRDHARAVRQCRVGLRVRRRRIGPAHRGIRRPFRPQEIAAVLLYRFHRGHPVVRPGADLRIPAAGAHRHRVVWRRHRLGGAGDRHRPVSAADARSRDGLHPDGICRQPGAGHPLRHLSIESLELARAVPRAGGARPGRWIADRLAHAAGRRAPEAAAGTRRLRSPAAYRDRAALPAVVRLGAVPGDRRLHADAVQQRLHREQPRHLARTTCP